MLIPFHLPRSRTGFTLIEINLVLLLFGVGVTALLGLFPVGLRQSGLAVSDTRQSMFAEMILNSIYATAQDATDYSDWETLEDFRNLVKRTKIAGNSAVAKADQPVEVGKEVVFDKYLGQKRNVIRYYLTVSKVANDNRNFRRPFYRATVQVSDRKDGKFHRESGDSASDDALSISPTYSIDLIYLGEVP